VKEVDEMKKLLVALSVLIIVSLTGCKGQAQADYGDTEDYELPNVTRIVEQCNDVGYNYLIDNNTGVVYIEYDSKYGRAISVMFNADGTVMTEKDIKKE
jgi:uncharacterized lipoprotein NlpE involved in copper resistance